MLGGLGGRSLGLFTREVKEDRLCPPPVAFQKRTQYIFAMFFPCAAFNTLQNDGDIPDTSWETH